MRVVDSFRTGRARKSALVLSAHSAINAPSKRQSSALTESDNPPVSFVVETVAVRVGTSCRQESPRSCRPGDERSGRSRKPISQHPCGMRHSLRGLTGSDIRPAPLVVQTVAVRTSVLCCYPHFASRLCELRKSIAWSGALFIVLGKFEAVNV